MNQIFPLLCMALLLSGSETCEARLVAIRIASQENENVPTSFLDETLPMSADVSKEANYSQGHYSRIP
jgi:hypothetical protein